MLWTCLLLPSLPLEVYARAQAPADAARPFAVTTGGHAPRVVVANAAAVAAGVHAGQLLSAALALAPDIVLRERVPRAEAAALAAVATWATQFTPAVSLAPPDAVLAEIGGSLRLFGGLPRLAAHVARGVHALGYTPRLAFAPTPTAALLFARADERGIGDEPLPGRGRRAAVTLAAALAPLPLAHLDVDADALATLAAAGVTTFGAARALPRDALARRVGGSFVATLDRALGLAADPRPPFVPPPRYEGRLELPAAVDGVEALAFALNRLVHELAGWLLGRGLGLLAVSLALAHERHLAVRAGGAATRVRFALAAPAREPAHLVAVLRERLARVVLPAPVVAIALSSEETAPLASRDLPLLPDAEPAPVVPLLDRLRARLGDDAVLRVRPHPEHRPERAWKGESDADPSPAFARALGRATRAVADPGLVPRPLWLLAEPEPLGRLLGTRPWALKDGPERIESGWWDGGDVRRDYFVAESPGGETVWIYRDHRHGIDDGEWFLHGVFS
jgi:protein ImuB